MFKRFNILIFVVALVALLAFQGKVVLPALLDIVSSDLFLEDSGDEAILDHPVTDDMTGYAFEQCNAYIAEEIDDDAQVAFPSQPLNAWHLGNFQYVVNAEVEIIQENEAPAIAKYVCRIAYDKKSDHSEAYNKDNWSIKGVGGLDKYM